VYNVEAMLIEDRPEGFLKRAAAHANFISNTDKETEQQILDADKID
jgi:hypothetical protein